MPRMIVDQVAYHYRVFGTGKPLLLLHGFTGSSLSWNGLASDQFSQMEVVALDLPGHGQSDSPSVSDRYAIDRVARDVVEIADQLGLKGFSLLGYSMGGRLALYLALSYPERIEALILESASPGIANASERTLRREWDYAVAEQIERDGIRAFFDHWEQLPLFASQTAVPQQKRTRLRAQRLQNNAPGLANSLRGMGTGSQPSLWPALPTLTTPTLLLCGELDDKYVYTNQRMAQIMPNVELIVVPNAGHNIHFEKPGFFTSAVINFLKNTPPQISKSLKI